MLLLVSPVDKRHVFVHSQVSAPAVSPACLLTKQGLRSTVCPALPPKQHHIHRLVASTTDDSVLSVRDGQLVFSQSMRAAGHVSMHIADRTWTDLQEHLHTVCDEGDFTERAYEKMLVRQHPFPCKPP